MKPVVAGGTDLAGLQTEPAGGDGLLGPGAVTSVAMPDTVEVSLDGDLRESILVLSELAASKLELTDLLTRVAEYAAAAIDGADGAGLTLLADGHAEMMVVSTPFVAEVDAIQYVVEEGPSITAATEARTVRSRDLDADSQWVRFGPLVAHLGVHSVLSIPLVTPAGVLGAINVYARQRDAFDDSSVLIGELFAVPAAIAVENAKALAQTKRLATQLRVELIQQAAIGQAVGILMSRFGCTSDDAIDRIRQISRTTTESVHAVADRIVAGAVELAHAGHANPWLAPRDDPA